MASGFNLVSWGFSFTGDNTVTSDPFIHTGDSLVLPVSFSLSLTNQPDSQLFVDVQYAFISTNGVGGTVTYDYTPVPEPRLLIAVCALLGTLAIARIIQSESRPAQ